MARAAKRTQRFFFESPPATPLRPIDTIWKIVSFRVILPQLLWARALAATDFCAFVERGLPSIFPALLATCAPVSFVDFFVATTGVPWDPQAA